MRTKTHVESFLTHKKKKEMIFKLLNERSFTLNNQLFLTFFDHIKILTKDIMKRNFVQIGNIKKIEKNIFFYS